MRLTVLSLIGIALVLQGCASARSDIYQGARVSKARALSANEIQVDKPILMIRGNLPDDFKVEPLGEISAASKRYSSLDRMYKELAIRARRVGADAVVNVNIKYKVAAFGWAVPTIAGVAVKITEEGAKPLKSLDGQWR